MERSICAKCNMKKTVSKMSYTPLGYICNNLCKEIYESKIATAKRLNKIRIKDLTEVAKIELQLMNKKE